MDESSYDFESGHLSLDYANTQDWHGSAAPVENLNGYVDLVSWGEQAGLITAGQAHQLKSQASQQPEKANRDYEFAIQLREALYHIFSSLYAGEPVPPADLTMFNSVVREAMAGLELFPSGEKLHWDWAPGIAGVDLILWPVARAAADLLTSDAASRVRECEDDRGCGYLFIDQSKNHSRRWCSMESCGNRAKARRHYSKIQAI